MEPNDKKDMDYFRQQVDEKEKRKFKALNEKNKSPWYGLGMFGMVGWSIAVPTLLGVFMGIWLDKQYPSSISWTLTFLLAGLFGGCLIAWHWVAKEDKDEIDNKKEHHE